MGLGNGNSKSGNKGSNYNYELRVLQLLNQIREASPGGSGGITPVVSNCTLTNLQNTALDFGAGSKAFAIDIQSGTVLIDGVSITGPRVLTYSEDSPNTLSGIAFDSTGDPAAIVYGSTVE